MSKLDYTRVNNYCLIIIAAIAITYSIIWAKSILLPFVFAIFIYSAFVPFCARLSIQLKIPKWSALFLGLFLSFLFLFLIVLAMAYSVNNFLQEAQLYKDQILSFIETAKTMFGSFGLNINASELKSEIQQLPILKWIKSFTGNFFSLIGNLVLVSIFTLFLIVGDSKVKSKSKVLLEVQSRVSNYISTKFIVSLITGLLVGLVFLLFGVELAFLFALAAFLLNFIPSVGSIISTLLPVPVLLLQFQFGIVFWTVLLLTGGIQMIIGNVIEPKLMGESMDLHPIAILLFLMFWGAVWGLPGMFLAVPISAILRIVLSKLEATRPLAKLMAAN